MSKNILIVDDSALMRWVLSDIIETDERYHIYAQAANGLEAMEELINADGKIDVVILDINMPKMDGIQVMDEINKLKIKVKVIVFSTVTDQGKKITMQVLEKGAFDFVKKPDTFSGIEEGSFKKRLLDCIDLACKSNVYMGVDHSKRQSTNSTTSAKPLPPIKDKEKNKETKSELKITPKRQSINSTSSTRIINRSNNSNKRKLVFIATSTGGPNALHEVIPKIDNRIDAPVVVVQHMPKGFTKYLADRLNDSSKLPVKEAEQDEILKKGVVYLAPGGFQLILEKAGKFDAKFNIYRNENLVLNPCADETLYSMKNIAYDEIICVVLTGMGKDATDGVAELAKYKSLRVVAQDEKTSVVYGMPNMVRRTGLVNEIVRLEDVAKTIINYAGVR